MKWWMTILCGVLSMATACSDEDEAAAPPDPPQLSRTEPVSGSDDNMPVILGNAGPGSTITIFDDGNCSNGVGSTIADSLGDFSIAVTVDDDTNNTFSARATDAAGNSSNCSSPLAYNEVTTRIPYVAALRPFAPVRVDPSATVNFDLAVEEGNGTATASWTILSGGGSFADPSVEDAVYTAPATPGVVHLQVEVANSAGSSQRDLYVWVEAPVGQWWTVAEQRSRTAPALVNLVISQSHWEAYGGLWLQNLSDSPQAFMNEFDVFAAGGAALGGSPLQQVSFSGFLKNAHLAVGGLGGFPHIAWSDPDSDDQLRVQLWDVEGRKWHDHPGDLSAYSDTGDLFLDFERETPYLVFETRDPGAKVKVIRYRIGEWEELPSAIEDLAGAFAHIRMDVRGGVPVVALKHGGGNQDRAGSVYRWNATSEAWDELGDLDSHVRHMSEVVVLSDGTPIVSYADWDDGALFGAPTVVSWSHTSSSWTSVGDLAAASGVQVEHARMDVDSEENIYVVVDDKVWRTTGQSNWASICGGGTFGNITGAFNAFGDLVIHEDAARGTVVYVAYPDGDNEHKTTIAACRPE